MSTFLYSAIAILASYLIGAIPFGYLLARWLKGVDVRTVGSGNIGATNVARVLGFRFFWPVFLFDMAKGYLPTLLFPRLIAMLIGHSAPADLPVLLALACILGHNYPVYLKFKGGKGVATSLGVMFALDPVASLASVIGFIIFLLITRYVSLASLLAGWVFFFVYFKQVVSPWSWEHRAMSILVIGLNVLLLVRHRKNLVRIGQGTEPKVSLRKSKDKPAGFASPRLVILLAVVSGLSVLGWVAWSKIARREVLQVGRYRFAEVARVATGLQRAERVAFADGGNLLAVTCPRYDRVLLYRVTAKNEFETIRKIALEGKPVAVCPMADRIYVLVRPAGDRRHVEPGWWETFDFAGNPVGERVGVGFYPDDMALSSDGTLAYVLTSGKGEGGSDRPAPSLDVYRLRSPLEPVSRLVFDGPKDDPARLTLSLSGQCAVVSLLGSKTVAAIDLYEPEHPRLLSIAPLTEREESYPSRTGDDSIIMPVTSGAEAVRLPLSGFGECSISTRPHESGLGLTESTEGKSLGRLTLRAGSFNLGKTRPTGLAYSPERGLIAVANRSGGVHLVEVRIGTEAVAARTSVK